MKDIMDQLDAITRQTGTEKTPAGEGRSVALRRTYPAEIADVWDAITTAERINRWFLPISGDLRLGGHYQLEGNAGGEVLACEPPHRLRVSWVVGEQAPFGLSEVEVRLTQSDGGTLFELEHTAVVPPQMWDQFGPGAVGVGWDLALLGLGEHLNPAGTDMSNEDKQAWMMTDEAREYMTACSQAWGEAHQASGASPAAAQAAVAATTAAYVPPME